MSAKPFPDAADFPPGSMRYLRDQISRTQSLENAVATLAQALANHKQEVGAANAAVGSLAGQALTLLGANPGDPPEVNATAFAYFTASGYPAGGLNVSWNDTGASHYEVWVRPVRPDPGETTLPPSDTDPAVLDPTADMDSQRMTATPDTYTTVRGLECNTQYAVKVRPRGAASIGDYSDEVIVTTPNEGTRIPAGAFTASSSKGLARLTWTGDAPATSNMQQTNGGTDLYTDYYLFASGVQAANGLVYFASTSDTTGGMLIVDPVAHTDTLVHGSTTTIGSWHFGRGMLAPDGRIFYLPVGVSSGEHHVFIIDPSTNTVTMPTITGSSGITTSIMGNDGKIYAFRANSGPKVTVTVIDPVTLSSSSADFTPPTTGNWYPAAAIQGQDGLIYMANGDYLTNPGTDPLLAVYDPTAGNMTFSRMGAGAIGTYACFQASVLMPNGQIYFIPGIGLSSAAGPDPVLIVDPATGTATLGASVPQVVASNTYMTNNALALRGNDGCIYWTGRTSGVTFYDCLLIRFDPGAGTYSTTSLVAEHGYVPYYSLAATSSGQIVGAPGEAGASGSNYDSTNLVMYVTSAPGSKTPNYLKYMQIERLSGGGWTPVTTLAAPGTALDAESPGTYNYRMVPVSTAGTRGTPSETVTATIT